LRIMIILPQSPKTETPGSTAQAQTGAREAIRVLVCLSASPSNQKVIRSAARYAQGNQRPFTALYIDDGRLRGDRLLLRKNMELARSLGAFVEIITQKDVLGAITSYALDMAVTDLFIGYSGPSRADVGLRHLPAYKLVHALPGIDVHIIPDAAVQLHPSRLEMKPSVRFNTRDFLLLAGIMAAATALSVLIDRSQFSNSNIVTVYILAVLVTSAMTAERMYGIIAAVLYILLFNFLFIEPRFSLLVYDPYYMVTYLVSFIAAIITGNISSRMKQITLRSRMNAYQAQILLDASEALQQAQGNDEIVQITVSRLHELLGRDIMYYDAGHTANLRTASRDADADLELLSRDDEQPDIAPEYMEAIRWTLIHNQRTGWGTKYFPDIDHQFLSVRTGNAIYGVIGVSSSPGSLNRFEENILLSLISECALSLESEKNRRDSEAALIVAENERFRSKLLRSVSHDLRTPLTSISGNASNLISHGDQFTLEEKQGIYADIYEDAIWLIDLVENLLAITRLEERVAIHASGEVVGDVLRTAVENAQRHRGSHRIILQEDDECLVAEMDAHLIMQVLDNLIANAVKHTPDGTTIVVSDRAMGEKILVSVADDGPGISPEDRPHIFELFFTGHGKEADSGRSLGLGLNLCRSIMEAHGQSVSFEDNVPHGSIFTFSLQRWKGLEENETLSDTGC